MIAMFAGVAMVAVGLMGVGIVLRASARQPAPAPIDHFALWTKELEADMSAADREFARYGRNRWHTS